MSVHENLFILKLYHTEIYVNSKSDIYSHTHITCFNLFWISYILIEP